MGEADCVKTFFYKYSENVSKCAHKDIFTVRIADRVRLDLRSV